ncbi:hypothetical protein MPSEU_000242000 [Mayamaea pseudoterrestris]|nr:hypothetical protein MPSEU_000242000 [Mayamaea pseudoterrestris]
MRIQRRIVGRQVLATACVFAFSSTRPADGFVLPSTRPRVSGSCYFPCRSPQHSYTANYIRQESSAEAELEWEAGDVYEEFEQLERAIAIHQAEQNLNHYERIQRLQDFANQRRPLYPDLHKYIIGPFVAALGVTAICKTIPQQPSWIGGSLRMALALHFWTTVVAFPLLMYIIKRVKQPPPKPLPSELQDLGPEFSQFLPLTESEHDRRKRTDDCTMCLSEQVSSAVIGTACLSSFLAPDMRPALYLLTRLGALLSWYQYPKLLSDLTRQDQPRPVTWDVYAMQIIRKWQGSTWMLVPALAQVLMSLDWEVIGQIYGAVGVAYVAARIRPSLFSGETNLLPSLLTLMTVLATAAWLFDQQRVIQLAVAVVRIVGVQNRLWRFVLVRNLGPLVPFVLAALPTLIHIVAFRKVMRVSKISNVSLASNVEEYQQASETPVATATWRWRTAWRDPQRMGATIRRWWGDFVYGIFLSGSVEDKLLRESIRRRRSLVAENSVLSRLSRELSTGDPAQRPSPDRSLWKAQAMGRLKQKHEQDYARGVYDVSAA